MFYKDICEAIDNLRESTNEKIVLTLDFACVPTITNITPNLLTPGKPSVNPFTVEDGHYFAFSRRDNDGNKLAGKKINEYFRAHKQEFNKPMTFPAVAMCESIAVSDKISKEILNITMEAICTPRQVWNDPGSREIPPDTRQFASLTQELRTCTPKANCVPIPWITNSWSNVCSPRIRVERIHHTQCPHHWSLRAPSKQSSCTPECTPC
jgi:hypothetical protein